MMDHSYKVALKALHSAVLQTRLSNDVNPILNGDPPDIKPIESGLPRDWR